MYLFSFIIYNLILTSSCLPTQSDNRPGIIIKTLQDQFYNQTSGLWRPPTGWWNSANALEALIEYTLYTKDTTYVGVIQNTFKHTTLIETEDGSFDDAQWWGIAWMRAYQLTGQLEYKERSLAIWNYIRTQAWDDHCGGGVWWSSAKTYKNAITNQLFFVLSILSYQYDNQNPIYLDWALKEWAWFESSGMINSNHLINDGIDNNCKNNGQTIWTYNQGVVLGGLTYLALATNNDSLLTIANSIADAVYTTLVYSEGGVLREPCELNNGFCDSDQVQFKGIFTRYLGILVTALPSTDPHRQKYITWLSDNADSIWKSDLTNTNNCGLRWVGPPTELTGTAQTSALDCFNAVYLLRSFNDNNKIIK